MIRRYRTLLATGLLALQTACYEPCGLTSEPTLSVDCSHTANLPAYTRVYGLGGNGQPIPFSPNSINNFPVSLVSDSSVYIFEAPDHTDTLAIGYERIRLAFQVKRCGFTMGLTNVRILPCTTFKDAQLTPGYQTASSTFNYAVVTY